MNYTPMAQNIEQPVRPEENRFQDYFLNAALLISFVLVFLIFKKYVSIILLAFVLTVIFHPIFLKIKAGIGNRDMIASLLTTLLIIIIVLVPLVIFASLVFRELQSALSSENGILFHASNIQLPDYLNKLNVDFKSYVQNIINSFAGDIGNIFQNIAQFFVYLVLCIIALIYFFKDGISIRKALFSTLPFTRKQRTKLSTDLAGGVRAVIGGYILVAIIQGVVSGVGYTVFGVPNPALWGFLAFICSLIPTFGSAIVNIPIIIFLFLNQHTGNAIGMTIWYITSISIIDNYIGPRFVSGRTNIHPLLIIISLLGGLDFFGAIGFITGPLILILFWSILEMFREREEEQEALLAAAKEQDTVVAEISN